MTTETERDKLRQILGDNGLTDNGGHPHSWRCEHPDRFPDYCDCVDDMIDAILAWMDARKVPTEVTDAQADAANQAFHEFVIGPETPLSKRDLGITQHAWKVAIRAALDTTEGEQ